jgi:hypothetical protein
MPSVRCLLRPSLEHSAAILTMISRRRKNIQGVYVAQPAEQDAVSDQLFASAELAAYAMSGESRKRASRAWHARQDGRGSWSRPSDLPRTCRLFRGSVAGIAGAVVARG